jgi:hypothetical protein
MILEKRQPLMNSIFKIFIFSVLTGFFFVAIGREMSLWTLFGRWEFYLDFFCVVIIVFIVTLLMARINGFLENKYPWASDFKRRIGFQFLLNVLGVTAISFLLVYSYMEFILKQDIFLTTYFDYEMPISIVVILVINLLFVIQYFVEKEKPSDTKNQLVVVPQKIFGYSGKSKIGVEPCDIIYIEKDGAISFLYLEKGEKLVHYGTLEELERKLVSKNFFRSNRQTIVQRSNCLGFETERSGQVNLTLKLPPQKQIKISQKKAREFKTWFSESG